MTDTVLIVDDEESVRRTFQEWLASSGLAVRVFAAADAESALRIANEHPIDLAILDWNLGSGSDGLRLLEDLVEFRPDVVAILVTGFAHQATPLDALRMGAPPHGGFALGIERFVALLAGEPNIREVIAFPKTASGSDPLTGAPAPTTKERLDELGISLRTPKP